MIKSEIISILSNFLLCLLIFICSVPLAAQNVGVNTTTPLAKLHVDVGASLSDGILFSGMDPSGGSFPSLGAGHRLMYYPGRGVFRAGYVDGTHWDNSQVGAFSFAFGYNPIARGNGSTAFGDAVYAGGSISTAFGNSTQTKGYSSFVLGMYNDPLLLGADQDVETPKTPLLMVGNGDGNSTRNNALTVFKNGDVVLRNYSTVLVDPGVILPPVTGPGTRMMWIAEKSAFRLGTVHNDDWNADSIGTWSTGIGYSTKAKGQFSLALGLQTTASGTTSTALGYNTTARGSNSIAMGSVTTALGSNSTSIGFKTYAGSYGSVSMGRYNDTIVNANRTAWINTDPLLILGNGTSDGSLHNTLVIYKNGNIISKNPTLVNVDPGTIPLPVNGPGTRMMWVPEKGAFRAGTVDNTNWDADSLGSWSTGLGFSTKAKGAASFAAGFTSTASGVSSAAFGYGTKAGGENSMAMGSGSIASGPVTTAMGLSTTASGFYSIAMGSNTKASGTNTTALGYKTYARSYGSMSIGRYNDRILTSDSLTWNSSDPLLIVGNGTSDAALHNTLVIYKNGNVVLKNPITVSVDPGEITTPIDGAGTRMMWLPEKSAFRAGTTETSSWDGPNIGGWSFASGLNTEASGSVSTALGISTKANGIGSTAMGIETVSSGNNSLAAGGQTIAFGNYSTALGLANRAMGTISSVSGHLNIAKGFSSTVIGLCNDSILLTNQITIDPLTPLLIVGNGDGGGVGQRRNAMVVRKDGHVGIGTSAPNTFLHVDVGLNNSDGILVNGTYNPDGIVPNLGAGSRMSYIPGKAAFRAGRVLADQWDNNNTGVRSFAAGYNTKASAQESTAFGSTTMATGPQAFAFGSLTVASGTGSTAMGSETKASGDWSTTMGRLSQATGDYAIAVGYGSIASAYDSYASGYESKASGGTSTATGYRTAANSIYSFTSGNNTIAKGYASTVVGMYNDSMFLTNETAVTDTTPLFIVGNGGVSNRHNALVIYKNGNAEIDGYTRLGDSTATSKVPSIKMKKLTGTSAASQNAWTNVTHGLTKSKILSVDIIMTIPGFVNLPPSYIYHPGYEYNYQVANDHIVVINSSANSYNALSRAFTILIVYEE